MGLNRKEVRRLVTVTVASLPHAERRTCDCFQGFITQLELDAGEDVSDVTSAWKASRDQMHGCRGCDPCPPGSAFAEYIMETQGLREAPES